MYNPADILRFPRWVAKVIRVSLPLLAISAATFVAEDILKIAATFSRSIFATVSVCFAKMGVSPLWADASFREQSLAKHSRIASTNGFGKIQIPRLQLQPTHCYWTSSLTLSLPHSNSRLMIAFTPLKRSFLLYDLAKRRAFAREHRRRMNRKQEKKYLQSARCLSLSPLLNIQRFLLLKKLLMMSISRRLICLRKRKMRHIVLRLQKMSP